MATKNPRLQVMLDKSMYEAISALSQAEGVSLSTTARDLIKAALERLEDDYLLETAEARLRKPGKLLTMKEMRKRLDV